MTTEVRLSVNCNPFQREGLSMEAFVVLPSSRILLRCRALLPDGSANRMLESISARHVLVQGSQA
jgi:hypothetical protein